MFFATLRKHMRWLIIVVVAAFVAGSLYVGFNFGQTAGEAASPVAEVNGRAISSAELQQVYLNNVRVYNQLFGTVPGPMAEELRYLSLNSLIDSYLTLEAARSADLPVDPQEIDQVLEDIKAGFSDDAAYREALAAGGLTESRLRDLIRDDLLVQKFQEHIRAQAQITDDDVRRAMREVRVRHILIEPERADDGATDEAAWEAALARAQAVREEIASGKPFEEAAAEYSADAATAGTGGDLGWVGQDSGLEPDFIDAALALVPGQVSEPVRTAYGYHLIEVTERREPTDEEFAEKREEVMAQLQAAAGQERWLSWMAQQRQRADIVIHDPQLRARQLVESGQLEEAVGYYQQAIQQDPYNPYLHVSLAQVYRQLGRLDEAIVEYEAAAEQADRDPDLWVELAQAYREAARDDDAVEALRRAGELNPWDAGLQLTLWQLFTEMDRPEDAAKASERLAAIQEALQQQAEDPAGEVPGAEPDAADSGESPAASDGQAAGGDN
ncbi:MAG: SurA N-terminal domain-containing protein [Firmicutes bacterium]|nr:SurA N-terminal domain-containing protein [Bacillota bacterium]